MNDLGRSIWPEGTLPSAQFCEDCDRLTVVAAFGLDDLKDDPELARIARFAAQLCEAPMAMVSIIEESRQRFIAREGIEVDETPREYSFCEHAMVGGTAMIVPDAAQHPTFRTNPLVTGEPHIRFYAGMPLVSSEGAPIGSLCIIAREARPDGLSDLQTDGLAVLAQAVMRRLESLRQNTRSEMELTDSEARLRFMLDSVPDIAWSAGPGGEFDQFNARWAETTGAPIPNSVPDWEACIHPDDWADSNAKFEAAMEKAEPFEDHIRLRQENGTYRWMLSRAVPTHDNPATARWFGTLTDVDDAYRQGEQQEILAQELAHRIKNIFAVVNGLIALRSREKPEAKDFASELSATIGALGRAQDFVRPLTTTKGDSLRGLLDVLTAPYGVGEAEQVTVTGDRVRIGMRASTPMALIFHEMATNSAKYGALSVSEGSVEVDLDASGDTVRIAWRESGGPAVAEPVRSGFGSRLLQMSVESQLNGSIEREWATDGLQVRLTIPKASLIN